MEFKNILSLIFIYTSIISYACDMCGAPNPSNGLGIAAQSNRSSITISNSLRTFQSKHRGVFGLPDERTKEGLFRSDLIFSIRSSKRTQIRLQLPYHLNQQITDSIRYSNSKFGDVILGANLFLLNKSISDTGGIEVFRITLTPGIKAPTGIYPSQSDERKVLYTGTGSWDPMLTGTLFYRKDNWGVLNLNQGLIRTYSKSGMKFGNAFSTSFLVNYFGKNFVCFGGINSSYLSKTFISKNIESSTISKGYSFNFSLGINKQWENFLLQINSEIPLYQNFNDGDVKQKLVLGISFTYLMNEK